MLFCLPFSPELILKICFDGCHRPSVSLQLSDLLFHCVAVPHSRYPLSSPCSYSFSVLQHFIHTAFIFPALLTRSVFEKSFWQSIRRPSFSLHLCIFRIPFSAMNGNQNTVCSPFIFWSAWVRIRFQNPFIFLHFSLDMWYFFCYIDYSNNYYYQGDAVYAEKI